MTRAAVSVRLAAALRRAHESAGWEPAPPLVRPDRVVARPVPLDRLIGAFNVVFDEVSGLTRAAAAAQFVRWGVEEPRRLQALLQDTTPLAGLLFAKTRGAYMLVCRDDSLPRRRFTAAHELGHLLLHFPREGNGEPAGEAPLAEGTLVMGDEAEAQTVSEAVCDAAGGREHPPGDPDRMLAPAPNLPWREREANRFAAQLLMPEAIVRSLYEHYTARYGQCQRFLEGHIAGDLLVSRQAARYRLADLGLAA